MGDKDDLFSPQIIQSRKINTGSATAGVATKEKQTWLQLNPRFPPARTDVLVLAGTAGGHQLFPPLRNNC